MSIKNRPNRKSSDADLIRLNSVGLPLKAIASRVGCHPSTVTQRLQQLNVAPADTRRAFMEDIYQSLSLDQQTWLENQLGAHVSIKDYVKRLLVKEYLNSGEPRAA